MRLIRRSSRRFAPRMVDYTYPELRGARASQRKGLLPRPWEGAGSEVGNRSKVPAESRSGSSAG